MAIPPIVETIKMLTLRALVSDEYLMYGLVLKGGNALELAYNITDRGSKDIDFSIEGDFTPQEYERLDAIFQGLLSAEFEKHNLVVIDVKFKERPKQNKVKEWKGYQLEFKVVDYDKYDPDDIDKSRRLAHKIHENESTKFSVDISSYEYVKSAVMTEVEGTIFKVYTPEMITLEKLRALCQSMPEYKEIVSTARQKGRARDFYDIWNLDNNFKIDYSSDVNKKMLEEIFAAKRVPIKFLSLLERYRDIQREDWSNVEDTLTADNKGYDFYFEYVQNIVKELLTP
jgi:predicted nucleotidyltransferase component of viral defense system